MELAELQCNLTHTRTHTQIHANGPASRRRLYRTDRTGRFAVRANRPDHIRLLNYYSFVYVCGTACCTHQSFCISEDSCFNLITQCVAQLCILQRASSAQNRHIYYSCNAHCYNRCGHSRKFPKDSLLTHWTVCTRCVQANVCSTF